MPTVRKEDLPSQQKLFPALDIESQPGLRVMRMRQKPPSQVDFNT